MIPTLLNLRFPAILRGETLFLQEIRIKLLKRKLFGQRVHEYRIKESLTNDIRNLLYPHVFEETLAICNTEYAMQSHLMTNIHQTKLRRWTRRPEINSSSYPQTSIQFSDIHPPFLPSHHVISNIQHAQPSILSSSVIHPTDTNPRTTVIPSTNLQDIPPPLISLLDKGPKFDWFSKTHPPDSLV
jgi:hypothetical protein